jgi:large subunit ribosomal protein L5
MAKEKKTGAKSDAKSDVKPKAKAPAKTEPKAQAKPEAKGEAKAAKQVAVESPSVPKDYVPRLKKYYEEVVRKNLVEQFGYRNPMQVPRLDKIVLNMGVGEAVGDGKIINIAVAELARIAGQKPVIT